MTIGPGNIGDALPGGASEQRRVAAEWFQDADAGLGTLWTYFYSVGGDADEVTLDAYLHELADLPPLQANLLAITMREMDSEHHYWDHGEGQTP
jgi:hypothetical protein